jgi:signal transduction histidine kinase
MAQGASPVRATRHVPSRGDAEPAASRDNGFVDTTAARRLTAGLDLRLAGGLALAVGGLVEVRSVSPGDANAMVLNLAATLPLAVWRPRRAWLAAVVTFATFLQVCGVEALTVSAVAGLLTALYLAAASWPRPAWAPFAVPFLVNAIDPIDPDQSQLRGVVLLALVAAALLLGDAHRQRSRVVAERDASRRAMERSLLERVAMEERARIARELHDVVAHSLSMIAVQAETARLTTPGLPDEGRGRIEAIGATARDALTEMRRLLDVLRPDAGGGPEHEPQPGLAQVTELVDAARDTGASVRLTVSGPVAPLPPGVDLAAYRIVQEALTNARRHAPGAAVEIDVCYRSGAVRLVVRDDGPGPGGDEPGPGHGLLGMRERAAMAGGTLTTGRDGRGGRGGFVVEADLPVPVPGGEQ